MAGNWVAGPPGQVTTYTTSDSETLSEEFDGLFIPNPLPGMLWFKYSIDYLYLFVLVIKLTVCLYQHCIIVAGQVGTKLSKNVYLCMLILSSSTSSGLEG